MFHYLAAAFLSMYIYFVRQLYLLSRPWLELVIGLFTEDISKSRTKRVPILH